MPTTYPDQLSDSAGSTVSESGAVAVCGVGIVESVTSTVKLELPVVRLSPRVLRIRPEDLAAYVESRLGR